MYGVRSEGERRERALNEELNHSIKIPQARLRQPDIQLYVVSMDTWIRRKEEINGSQMFKHLWT